MIDNLKDLFDHAYRAVEESCILDVNLSDEIKDMEGCPMPLSGCVGLYDADKMAKWVFDVWKDGGVN